MKLQWNGEDRNQPWTGIEAKSTLDGDRGGPETNLGRVGRVGRVGRSETNLGGPEINLGRGRRLEKMKLQWNGEGGQINLGRDRGGPEINLGRGRRNQPWTGSASWLWRGARGVCGVFDPLGPWWTGTSSAGAGGELFYAGPGIEAPMRGVGQVLALSVGTGTEA